MSNGLNLHSTFCWGRGTLGFGAPQDPPSLLCGDPAMGRVGLGRLSLAATRSFKSIPGCPGSENTGIADISRDPESTGTHVDPGNFRVPRFGHGPRVPVIRVPVYLGTGYTRLDLLSVFWR